MIYENYIVAWAEIQWAYRSISHFSHTPTVQVLADDPWLYIIFR